MSKVKNILAVVLTASFVFGFSLWGLLAPDKDISESERRNLSKFPELSIDSVLSGEFMKAFEQYTLDHFPLRDGFRNLKALTSYYPLMQMDNNKFYNIDGYIVKMEYPMNQESVQNATDKFESMYNSWIKDKADNVYLSIIPDKNYFAAEKGYLSMDYNVLTEFAKNQMSYAQYIDIFPTLELSDYYKTDTHWKQENLLDTAKALASGMGVTLAGEYEKVNTDIPFYGVYYGQAALPHLPADDLYYLTNDTLKGCVVKAIESNVEEIPMYDMEKLLTADPYEMFLSGPNRGFLTIENPSATTDKELVIIRDSYANAITPLLCEGYKKITLIDIRKFPHKNLNAFINNPNNSFSDMLPADGCDVLFLMSTLVLNDSSEMK